MTPRRSSSDADVARALANPDWYASCVFALIQEEAHDHNLGPRTYLPPIARDYLGPLRRIAGGVFRLVNGHPLITIALIAAGIHAVVLLLPMPGSLAAMISRNVAYVAVYLLGTIGCC